MQDQLIVFEVALSSFFRDDPLEIIAAQAQYLWREPWPAGAAAADAWPRIVIALDENPIKPLISETCGSPSN